MGKRTCECDDALGQFCPKCHPLGDGADGYFMDVSSDFTSVRTTEKKCEISGETCSICNGDGKSSSIPGEECNVCFGTGVVYLPQSAQEPTALVDAHRANTLPPYPGLLYCRKHDDYYGVGTGCKDCMARKPALADFDGAEARYNALVGATDTPGVFPPYGMGRDIRVTGADPATECPDPFVGQRLQLMPKCRTDVAGQVEVLAMALDTVMRECGDKGMGHQATMEAVAQAAVDTILTPLFKKFDPGPRPADGVRWRWWDEKSRLYRRIRKAAGMPVPPTEEED